MNIVEIVVYPFSESINFAAGLFEGDYALAVILITLLIRICLLPLFIKQAKQQKKMRKSMEMMKPELEKLQEMYKTSKNSEEKNVQQKKMVQLYKKYDIKPLSFGCFPMLIQFPIIMGMYWAVMETSKLSHHFFLGFNFTETSIVLACVAGVIYYLQGKLSQDTTVVPAQPNMKWMMLFSPIIIFVVSLTSPAILPFYWSVNGVFLIIQNFIIKSIT